MDVVLLYLMDTHPSLLLLPREKFKNNDNGGNINYISVDDNDNHAIPASDAAATQTVLSILRFQYQLLRNTTSKNVCVCVRPPVEEGYLLTRYQSQGKCTPPKACDVIPPPDSTHQPLPGEMLADGCPLGNVYGTATGLPVGVLPSMSLCET
jgi:hypothetical protein